MNLEETLKAIQERRVIPVAQRRQNDCYHITAKAVTGRSLDLFDNGTFVGVWPRLPNNPDEIHNLGSDVQRAVEWLLSIT